MRNLSSSRVLAVAAKSFGRKRAMTKKRAIIANIILVFMLFALGLKVDHNRHLMSKVMKVADQKVLSNKLALLDNKLTVGMEEKKESALGAQEL
jgi:hypothetical protein